MSRILLLSTLSLLLSAAPAAAQSAWGVDGSGRTWTANQGPNGGFGVDGRGRTFTWNTVPQQSGMTASDFRRELEFDRSSRENDAFFNEMMRRTREPVIIPSARSAPRTAPPKPSAVAEYAQARIDRGLPVGRKGLLEAAKARSAAAASRPSVASRPAR